MSNVVAMPTTYKGYRFRSRLEARWAMFFDKTGVEWTFEPQPVLVNGEPYLPDFVIKLEPTSSETYHEVKSLHEKDRIKPVKAYLAGKIGEPHNWRGFEPMHRSGYGWFPQLEWLGNIRFDMTGPFMTADSKHLYIDVCSDRRHVSELDNNWLVSSCQHAIANCEVFCAHISTTDAWGTIAEIGCASAREKYISITFDQALISELPVRQRNSRGGAIHDMWFIETMADTCCVVSSFEEAQAFHSNVIAEHTTREYRLISRVSQDAPAVMTFGDPVDVANLRSCLGWQVDMISWCRDHKVEAEAVRQHRFDRQ